MKIWSVAGYKIFVSDSEDLIKAGWLMRPTIKFIKNYMPKGEVKKFELLTKGDLINETDNYAKFYEQFIYLNTWRNQAVLESVKSNPNKKILILTKLVDHGNMLAELTGGKHLYGGTSKKERKIMFDEFASGDLNVLVSTLSIFAEGINIPSLDIIINAGANKSNIKTIQVLGRVLRKLEGKDDACYIDFIDESRFFKSASFKRRTTLINEGHEVKIIDWEETLK